MRKLLVTSEINSVKIPSQINRAKEKKNENWAKKQYTPFLDKILQLMSVTLHSKELRSMILVDMYMYKGVST